jgi:hypothetical protein
MNRVVVSFISHLLWLAVFLGFLPFIGYTQQKDFSLGNFSFSLSPKVLETGTITEFALGYAYTDQFAGDLRLRYTTIAQNEDLLGVDDSLNAVNEKIFEIFLLPMEYRFLINPEINGQIGLGIYYEYDKLVEKGYFDMPDWGEERINSYTNDFSMHIIGPILDTRFIYRGWWFNLTIAGGIVPVFYVGAHQKIGIVPLVQDYMDYSQNTVNGPYVYTDLSCTFFKYVSLVFLYDFARRNYKIATVNDANEWYTPDTTLISQSFKLEASLLIPFGSGIYAQLGYGHAFDSMQVDSASPIRTNEHYLICSFKKDK